MSGNYRMKPVVDVIEQGGERWQRTRYFRNGVLQSGTTLTPIEPSKKATEQKLNRQPAAHSSDPGTLLKRPAGDLNAADRAVLLAGINQCLQDGQS